jgi:predicted Zn-dependent protease
VLACGRAPVGSALFGGSLERQGVELATEIEQQKMLIDDEALAGYVRAVGERGADEAVNATVPQFNFAVLDSPEPNAFALPSGHIYISRGLLVLLNSEDELAGVLGHEVGHVVGRHQIKAASRDLPLIPLRVVTSITGGVIGLVLPGVGSGVRAAGTFTSGLAHAPYSRNQEREADQIGQRLAASAGWDPEGISRVMDALAAEQRLHGSDPNRQSFLATHPTSPERSERTRALAAELEPATANPVAPTRAEFLDELDGLVVGEGAAGGVFDGPDFLQPVLGFTLEFPGGDDWKSVDTPTAVGALNEESSAAVVLEIVAEGDDALAVAQAFEPREGKLDGPPTKTTINGQVAARARGSAGRGRNAVRADLWWIVHDGMIYRLTGAAGKDSFESLTPQFEKTAESFRTLTAADRKRVFENRLRIEPARRGETLVDLLDRVGTSWTEEQATAANAKEPDVRLAADELIKVAIRERYE